MKFLIFALLISTTNSANEAITCDQSMALLFTQKVKNVALDMARKEGKSAAEGLDCLAIEKKWDEAYKTERKTKSKFCDLNKEAKEHTFNKSLEDSISKVIDSAGGDCYKDFAIKEIAAFIRNMGRPPEGVKDFCLPYASLHDKLQAKEDYCKEVSEAKKDPNSCEIPDANGLCPGQKPVVTPEPSPEIEDNRQYNIKWSGGAVNM
jgi:hypothetical protein